MYQTCVNLVLDTEDRNSPLKDRPHSNYTTASQSSLNSPKIFEGYEPEPSIINLFKKSPQVSSLSNKMTRKSVTWLTGVAWMKSYSYQTVWTALMLFYGFKNQRPIEKQFLEALLLICLQLSTKIHEKVPLLTSQLLLCSNRPIQKETLSNFEVQILQLFDYNLYTPNTFERIMGAKEIDEEDRFKVLFMMELLLSKNADILFDEEKCLELIRLISDEDFQEEEEHGQLINQLKEIAQDPLNAILYKRYGAKVDGSKFMKKLE